MKKYQYVFLLLSLAFFIFGCTAAVKKDVQLSKDMQLSNQSLEYIINRDYTKAEIDLNEALAINPDNPYAVLNIGVVYQNTNRTEKAKEMYEKVIKLNPQESASKSNAGDEVGKTLTDIAKANLKMLQ